MPLSYFILFRTVQQWVVGSFN